MNYRKEYGGFVNAVVKKHLRALPEYTREGLGMECWAAIMSAINRWDGSKGSLNAWVHMTVYGRMKDLRKKHAAMKRHRGFAKRL